MILLVNPCRSGVLRDASRYGDAEGDDDGDAPFLFSFPQSLTSSIFGQFFDPQASEFDKARDSFRGEGNPRGEGNRLQPWKCNSGAFQEPTVSHYPFSITL